VKKVITFNEKKLFFQPGPDIDLLNKRIQDLEELGWNVKSVSPVAGFLGGVMHYELFIESGKNHTKTDNPIKE
jgi:hypothetical protein